MADDSNVRTKIHSLWEAFFPSTIYFFLFLLIAAALFGIDPFLTSLRGIHIVTVSDSSIYEMLKETELLKLVPLVLAFSLTLAIYLFDRIVAVVGNFLPPFPFWSGSSALYVEEYYLRELWSQLPTATNVAALDYEAKNVIDQAVIEEKHLPQNSLEWLGARQNKAVRLSLYAKSGIVWTLLVF